MLKQMHLLKSSRFLPLFITQFFGAFNDNAFKNSLLIWFTYDIALEQDLDAPFMVTLAAGLFILPLFLFSATAGQIADKVEKSWLTRQIKLVEIFLMLSCSVLYMFQSVYGLLVVLFLMGVQSTFFGPIKYSLLPEHLKKDELIGGNGLIEGGTFLSILLGTIFGGLVIRLEHGVELLALSVIVFSLIGWYSSRYIPRTSARDPTLKIRWNIVGETWKIIGFARNDRTVWFSIIGISWFWLIGVTFLTQFPTYTKGVVGGNEHIVTLFLTIFSVGIGVGSLWCNKLLKGEINGRLVPYGAMGMAIALFLFVFSSYAFEMDRQLYLAQVLNHQDKVLVFQEFFKIGLSSGGILFSLLMLSVCGGIYIVPLYTMIQYRSEEKYLARIIAANNVMNALFMVLASVVILFLFALDCSLTNILTAIGLLNVVVFFVARIEIKRRINDA